MPNQQTQQEHVRVLTWMVLMAAMPSQPAARAVRAGAVMSVMLGVILAHTGLVAMSLIQPLTSCTSSSSGLCFLDNCSSEAQSYREPGARCWESQPLPACCHAMIFSGGIT